VKQTSEAILPRADFADSVFRALNSAHIRYCVLRGYGSSSASCPHDEEIDLLIAPKQLAELSAVLVREGFALLRSWGHAPHQFFAAYDGATGSWLKLDVVTDIRFGRKTRPFAVPLRPPCLARRRFQSPIYVPAPEHEFLLRLLHCVLDKRTFREHDRDRLKRLRAEVAHDATAQERLIADLGRYVLVSARWASFLTTDQGCDWVLGERKRIARHLFFRDPLKVIARLVAASFLRGMQPLLIAMRGRGITVALLGPDGAGKSGLAQRLANDRYLQARVVYMGANPEASTLGSPLSGWLHARLQAAVPMGTRTLPLRALNLLNTVTEEWWRSIAARWHVLRGRCVVFDRYSYDAHAVAGIPSWRAKLRRRLSTLLAPTPDFTFVLDAPGNILYRRKGEHSPEQLEHQRMRYRKLAEVLPRAFVVSTTGDKALPQRQVTNLIWKYYLGKNTTNQHGNDR
jgi:thymidylate kinase